MLRAGLFLREGARFFVALCLTPMVIKHPTLIVAATVALLTLAAACTKPLGDIGFSESEKPRYAVPLLATEFTLRDALQGFDFVGTLRDDGGLRLVREDTIFNDRVVKSVEIQDLAAPLPDTFNTVSLRDFGFDIPISKLGLRSGLFSYALASGSDVPLEVTLVIPNLVNVNGDELQIVTVVAPGESITGTQQLAGRTIELNAAADFTINYTARTPSGQPTKLALAIVELSELIPQFVEGGLDSFPYQLGANTLRTEYLNTFEPNSASVLDASVTVEITNTAPVPLRFDGLGSYAALRDGGEFPFNTALPGGVLLNFPAQSGDTARTQFTLDDTNSDLLAAVRQFPDSLVFDLQAVVNPFREDETYRVEYLDRVIGKFIFDIPLAVDFDGFVVDQNFSFGEVEELERLGEAELVIVSTNLFGLQADAQVYLLSPDSVVVDSLFAMPLQLVESGILDATGRVTEPGEYVAELPLSQDQLAAIRAAPRAVARIFLRTPDGGQSEYAQLDYADLIKLRLGLNFSLE